MPNIPRDRWPDSTLALKRQGYCFITNRCDHHDADIFETRLLGQKVICVKGADAASMFYNNDHFQREGAMPDRIVETLLGRHGVQSLDGAPHRDRKQLFMGLMAPERLALIKQLVANEFASAVLEWTRKDQVVLFEEISRILGRAACEWAGLPINDEQKRSLTEQALAMIDAPAALGIRHKRGVQARQEAEEALANCVENLRRDPLIVEDKQSALYKMSQYRDAQGHTLDANIVAVELLNVVRPIVAIGRFITFMALALHRYPEARAKLHTSGEMGRTLFVLEVRRFYPFFPAVAAVVKEAFQWKGYHFPKGRRVMLDLYGTDHDPELWQRPNEFDPERFRHWRGSPFDYIPHGGGSFQVHHRCAGEWLTIEVMKVILYLMTQTIRYEVPKQDLHYSLSRMPTLPKSGFVVNKVQATSLGSIQQAGKVKGVYSH